MHKPEFVPENKAHKILWDFVIQTDHWSLTRGASGCVMVSKLG